MLGPYYTSYGEWHQVVRLPRAPLKWLPTSRLAVVRVAAAMLVLAGCSSGSPAPKVSAERKAPSPAPPAPRVSPEVLPEVLPEAFESTDFIVTVAKPGDTAESLATRYLGSPAKAWMVEEYAGTRSFPMGDEVVIPKREWNPPGVYASGYQLVPVLVYHNIGAQRKGRLIIAASTFEEQMRYLKAEGYRAIRLEDFLAYLLHKRQLPKKSVLVTFDDGHKGFVQYAHPVLKELGFPAVLFIQSDQIAQRPSATALSWSELRELMKENVEVQAHSKTHGNLRRASGESESAYSRRMRVELETPLALLRAQLPQLATTPDTIAYPYGEWDEDLLRYVKQYGYMAGFTVRREANAAFVPLHTVNRTQVFADWTLEDFKKCLDTFQQESILPETAPVKTASQRPSPSESLSVRQRRAARHNRSSDALESRGLLGQALDERKIALTIDPADTTAQEQRKRLETRIENEVATRMERGAKLASSAPLEARRHFLAALALNPKSEAVFDAVRRTTPALEAQRITPPQVKSLTHTVGPNETAGSLADLYYGNRSLGEVIEKANGLSPGAPLSPGRLLKIPEVSGVPFLRPD